jgi:hypothetical protein
MVVMVVVGVMVVMVVVVVVVAHSTNNLPPAGSLPSGDVQPALDRAARDPCWSFPRLALLTCHLRSL